jgi:hypothetical protein
MPYDVQGMWQSRAEVLPMLLRFGSRVKRCVKGSVAGAAGADAQPADPPAQLAQLEAAPARERSGKAKA